MRIALFVIFLSLSAATYAQQPAQGTHTVQYTMTKEEMMAKRKEIQDAINETEKQLASLRNDKQATMGQLRALQNKLAERQRLISNINDEVSNIDNDIRRSSREVTTLKQKLDMLKMRYVQSIRFSYENRSSYDMLTFMFSANDFNDMMRRMKYLKKFREYRRQQVDQILATQTQLKRQIGVLNTEKAQKDELLNTQMQQKKVLMSETDQTNRVIQDLKGKESKLMQDIQKQRQLTARINKAIENMIAAEMAKAAKKAEDAAKAAGVTTVKTPEAGTAVPRVPKPKGEAPELMLTPTDIALAADFEENRGKLYWPVEKGYITDRFGTHPHPLAPQVMVDNAGIDIQTNANARVLAVFDGTVSKVFSVAGSNWIVMVSHGRYFTIYNGLSNPSVKVGDKIKVRQSVGTVALNDEGLPVVNFQIWKSNGKNNIKLNPEQWIGKAR